MCTNWFHKKIQFKIWTLLLMIFFMIALIIATFLSLNHFFTPLNVDKNIQHIEQKSVEKINEQGSKEVIKKTNNNFIDKIKLILDKPELPISKLDGLELYNDIQNDYPIAVVIDNSTFARPQQSGLEKASIVYETLAEGGITRFLVIFNSEPVEKIGPIRSARPYFIDWAEEYGAAFTHIGGSPTALANLATSQHIFDIKEVLNDPTNAIWRDKTYAAPHNAFTSIKKLTQLMKAGKFWLPLEIDCFKFKKPDSKSGNVRFIQFNFSNSPSYSVKYIYNQEGHYYTRFNGGKSHHNIKPNNIIIQFTDQYVEDDEGRLHIQTQGTGKALIFRDGKVIKGSWEKDKPVKRINGILPTSFTKFLDQSGSEIELNRGQTWIEVVPKDVVVNYF